VYLQVLVSVWKRPDVGMPVGKLWTASEAKLCYGLKVCVPNR